MEFGARDVRKSDAGVLGRILWRGDGGGRSEEPLGFLAKVRGNSTRELK